MKRALPLFLLVLGIGIGITASSIFNKKPSVSSKPAEITSEATSTGEIAGIETETAVVKRVIDGDTIELSDGRKVRYVGIDTPETVDPRRPVGCFGKEASAKNKELVGGKSVELEKDISEIDKYGRLLRYVYVETETGRVMVNQLLVEEGYAMSSTFPPDVKYQEQFISAEQDARKAERGLWSACSSTPTPTSAVKTTTGNSSSLNSQTKDVSGKTTEETKSKTETTTITQPNSDCVIKGNISSSKEKIYHLPGCGSYDKTSIDESAGERWFCTEEEAVQAGWRKAKNC